MTTLKWHPSLKKTFKGCEVWWHSNMVKRDELREELARLQNDLDREGRFITKSSSTLMVLAQTLTMQACIASGKGELGSVPAPLCWGVTFRALDMLKIATRTYRSDASTLLLPFWTSMMAVGPTMLSDWERARLCAYYLIQLAHKDMRLNVRVIRKEGWGKGTNDAFLIHLFSQAYDIPTHYESVNPMVEPYRQLLEVWQTIDQDAFRHAMSIAADYHISRSKAGTDRNTYEFEKSFDRVYPGELLAVQALRRRDGLPEFDTGHVLVDTPWSIIRDMPECEPHPLAVALEARLRKDDPECW
jgi:hypothetical protein